jgi:spore germination cell wall hydrolase CwlJ-like protein
MLEMAGKQIVISTPLACLIGGLMISAALLDSYFTHTAIDARLQVVEEQTQETADAVQEIKNALVHTHERVKYTEEDEACLSKNIFYEAGVDSDLDKVGVGQVTLNRLKTKRWGDNICDVVHAQAQFSWTLFPKLKHGQPKGELWEVSQKIAKQVLHGLRVDTVGDSLFYHTDYIKVPDWADPENIVTKIDRHIYYTKAKFVMIKKKVKHKKNT